MSDPVDRAFESPRLVSPAETLRPEPPSKSEGFEAEMAMLGGMIYENSTIGGVLKIITDKAMLALQAHQTIFGTIVRLHLEKKPVDLVVLRDELAKVRLLDAVGGAEYLAKLVETLPSAANVPTYAATVAALARDGAAVAAAKNFLAASSAERANGVGKALIDAIAGVRTAPESKDWPAPMTREEIEKAAAKPCEWLIEPLIAKGQITLGYAPPKTFKSMLVEAVALAAENGAWLCGGFKILKKCRVAYLGFEDPESRMSYRLKRFVGQLGEGRIPDLFPTERAFDLILPRDEAKLIEWIKEKGYEILVLDTMDYTTDCTEGNSYADTRRWRVSVRRVATATNCAIVLVTHTAKGAKSRSVMQERAVGTISYAGLADTLFDLSRTESGDLLLEVVPKDDAPSKWRIKYDGYSEKPWAVAKEEGTANLCDRMLGYLRKITGEGKAETAAMIAKALDSTDDLVYKALKEAGDRVVGQKLPGKGGPTGYKLAAVAPMITFQPEAPREREVELRIENLIVPETPADMEAS